MSDDLKILRSQLAKIFPNDPRAIRAFEALFRRTGETIPTDVQAVEIASGNAEALAIQVAGAVSRLAESIDLLSLAPPTIPTASADADTWSSTTVDFGSTPVSDGTFTIVDASCTANSVLEFAISGASTTATNDANSHAQASALFSFAATPTAGQFSLDVGTMWGLVTGEFVIKYKVGV